MTRTFPWGKFQEPVGRYRPPSQVVPDRHSDTSISVMLDDAALKVKIRALLWRNGRTKVGRLADMLPPKDSCIQDVERVCMDMAKRGELRASKLGVWLPSSAPEWGKPR